MAIPHPNTLIDVYAKKGRPYVHLMRLHRPIGTWLCLLPALWGLHLGAPNFDIKNTFFFIVGAIFIRGAGCTINDIWDRNLDAHVTRTKMRPLAAGLLSKKQALIFFILQMMVAGIILFTFNARVIMMGLFIVIPILIYPLMKRVTYWPQIFLGLVFNWGCLMGWYVHQHNMTAEIFWMYSACVFWTIGYDTVYAFQDYADDRTWGAKSSALVIGHAHALKFTAACYLLFSFFLFGAAFMGTHIILSIGLIGIAPWIYKNIRNLDPTSSTACQDFFLWNKMIGITILILIILSKLMG